MKITTNIQNLTEETIVDGKDWYELTEEEQREVLLHVLSTIKPELYLFTLGDLLQWSENADIEINNNATFNA